MPAATARLLARCSASRRAKPAQVTGVTATDTLCRGVLLQWSDLPNETQYMVYRDNAPMWTVDSNVTSFLDSTVAVAPPAHAYSVSGVNACGEGLRSTDVGGSRAGVPARVDTVSASQDSCTSVTVHWNDVATETYYLIYRDGVRRDSVGANMTVYRDSPLTAGTYAYTIYAGNHCGLSVVSPTATGRVPSAPGLVQMISAVSLQCSTITVTWHDLPDELHYLVYRDNDTTTVISTRNANDTTYADSHQFGLHSYRVQASNVCGTGHLSAPISGTGMSQLPAPAEVNATDNNPVAVIITWRPVAGADSFRVTRGHFIIGFTHDTTFSDSNAGADTLYLYQVVAINACGDGFQPQGDEGHRPGILPCPDSISATDGLCDSVVVTWSTVQNADSFQIRRNGSRIGVAGAKCAEFRGSYSGLPHYVCVHNRRVWPRTRRNGLCRRFRLVAVCSHCCYTGNSLRYRVCERWYLLDERRG